MYIPYKGRDNLKPNFVDNINMAGPFQPINVCCVCSMETVFGCLQIDR